MAKRLSRKELYELVWSEPLNLEDDSLSRVLPCVSLLRLPAAQIS
jgi:hypothetical protein